MVPMTEPSEFALDTPAGLVKIRAECANGRATSITLENAPAYCRARDLDVAVDVPELGRVAVDIAYGGMQYAIVDAASVGLRLEPAHGREICRLGEMIKVATREQHPVDHPEFSYPGPDNLVFRGPATRGADGRLRARNAVVMSNNVLDWCAPAPAAPMPPPATRTLRVHRTPATRRADAQPCTARTAGSGPRRGRA
jgi:proline racemase